MFMFWVPLCTLIEFFFCMHFRHCHCGFRFYHIYLFVCFFPILGLSELPSDRPPPPPPPSPCVLSPRTKTRTQNNNNKGLLFCFYRESRCGVNWSGKATPFLIARVRHVSVWGQSCEIMGKFLLHSFRERRGGCPCYGGVEKESV